MKNAATNEIGLTATNDQPGEHTTNNLIRRQIAEEMKATVIAKAAVAGLAVYERADGSFVVSTWGYIKPLADLAAVMRMVRQIGGAA